VGLNSDGSHTYVIPTVRFDVLTKDLPEKLVDHRAVTPEEIFIYYSRDAKG